MHQPAYDPLTPNKHNGVEPTNEDDDGLHFAPKGPSQSGGSARNGAAPYQQPLSGAVPNAHSPTEAGRVAAPADTVLLNVNSGYGNAPSLHVECPSEVRPAVVSPPSSLYYTPAASGPLPVMAPLVQGGVGQPVGANLLPVANQPVQGGAFYAPPMPVQHFMGHQPVQYAATMVPHPMYAQMGAPMQMAAPPQPQPQPQTQQPQPAAARGPPPPEYNRRKTDDTYDTRCNIYVASMPKSFDDHKLAEFFMRFGPIVSAKVMCDHTTNISKGYGFVLFKHEESAARAVAEMAGQQVEGMRIQVRWAHFDATPTTRSTSYAVSTTEAGNLAVNTAETAAYRAPNMVHSATTGANATHAPVGPAGSLGTPQNSPPASFTSGTSHPQAPPPPAYGPSGTTIAPPAPMLVYQQPAAHFPYQAAYPYAAHPQPLAFYPVPMTQQYPPQGYVPQPQPMMIHPQMAPQAGPVPTPGPDGSYYVAPPPTGTQGYYYSAPLSR